MDMLPPQHLRIFCKVLGMDIFNLSVLPTLHSNHVPTSKGSVLFSVYRAMFAILQPIIGLHLIYKSCTEMWWEKTNNWAAIAAATSLFISSSNCLLSTFINHNCRQEIVRILLKIDQNIFQTYQKTNNKVTKGFPLISALLLSLQLCLVLGELFVMWQFKRFRLDITICFNIYHLIVLTASLNYSHWVLQIWQRLVILNVKIREECNSKFLVCTAVISGSENSFSFTSDPDQIMALRERRKYLVTQSFAKKIIDQRVIYEKLYKCIVLMNTAYGFQMLLVFLNNLVNISTHMRMSMMSNHLTTYMPSWRFVIYLVRTLLYLLATAMIASSCRRVNMEVKNTQNILQDLLFEAPLNGGLATQLEMFHHQISSRESVLSAAGVFTIDSWLFGSIVVMALSFLIVLIQMSKYSLNTKP